MNETMKKMVQRFALELHQEMRRLHSEILSQPDMREQARVGVTLRGAAHQSSRYLRKELYRLQEPMFPPAPAPVATPGSKGQ